MARKLPWLSSTSKVAKDDSKPAPAKRRKVTPRSGEDEDDEDSTVHSKRKATSRTPQSSDSPPTSPPKEEYMRDGYDADDACIMVEDEFLTTAKLYTSHLHHAEYQKLERLSLSQNEGAIKKLERPTDERTQMSIETRKKLEASKQRERSRVAFVNVYGNAAEEEDEDEDDPWLRDPRLAGLMRPKEIIAPLGNIAGIASVKTRASEGYLESRKVPVTRPFDLANIGRSSSPEDEALVRRAQPPPVAISEDDDEDDGLDEPSRPTFVLPDSEDDMALDAQYVHSKPKTPRRYFSAPRREPVPSRQRLDKPKPRPKSSSSRSKPSDPSSDSPGPDHDFDTLPLRRYHPNRPNALSQALPGRSKKNEDEKKRTLKVEDVPTFLF